MLRREFIGGVGGAVVLRPLAVRARQRVRRVGILSGLTENDPATKARLGAFREALAALGWVEGRNLRIDARFAPGVAGAGKTLVAELLALDPDVLLVQGPGTPLARAATKTVPIVFVVGVDPVGEGWVESLAHPGGNVTGFSAIEPSFGAKWLGLLKQIAPHVRRVAVIGGHANQVSGIVAAGRDFAAEVTVARVRSQAGIEAAITALAQKPDGGLILPLSIFTAIYRKPIIAMALRYRLPLVTGNPPFPRDGGLMYYGADIVDIYRRSASYVDRILKGAKPADLPVQLPTKFDLVINLKTAKALDRTVPPILLAEATQVIE